MLIELLSQLRNCLTYVGYVEMSLGKATEWREQITAVKK